MGELANRSWHTVQVPQTGDTLELPKGIRSLCGAGGDTELNEIAFDDKYVTVTADQ